MLFLRSLLFNVVFYASTIVQMVFWIPLYFLMTKEDGHKVVRIWGLSSLWFHHKIVGTTFAFEGLENIPQDGGYMVAGKHQSSWETFTLLLFLKAPSYILKRELMYIPLFGWYAYKADVVPVNRGKRSIALAKMTVEAAHQLKQDRQIIIFPEGTRVAPFAPPKYKFGIAKLYQQTGCRVLPMALNSGLFWSRQTFLRYPGKITMRFLPMIEADLELSEFRQRLENDIEKATDELMQQAEINEPDLPLAKFFRKRFSRLND